MNKLISASMASDKTTIIPVDLDANIRTVREFRNMLQTTMGPTGTCKIVVTGGGYVQVASESSTLLARLELENPICRYIAHVAAGLPDHGLYLGVLVSHLVEQLWGNEKVPKHKLSQIISSLIQSLHKILTSELVCRKVDFSSINCLLSLVRTIISSKCSVLCSGLDVERFCLEVVKVFINCIDDQTNSVRRVHVKVESGPYNCSSHNGLLYQIIEDYDIKNLKHIAGEVKIIVFTLKLENQYEESSVSVVSQIIKILDETDVKVVACQKTVAADIKLYLIRRNIILLERMGTEFTAILLHMSQSYPVSQIYIDLSDVGKMLGTLSTIQHIQFNEKDYILLQNKNVPVGTLLVQSSFLAGTDHVKGLAQQAVSSLRSLAAHPVLIIGGGCLEVWLNAQIDILQESNTDKDFRNMCHWLQRALLSTCGSSPPDAMDSVFHHGWSEEADVAKCNCGSVTRAMLERTSSRLIPVSEVINTCSTLRLGPPTQSNTLILADMIVHCHQQKLDVITCALETFANLSDIGLIVYKG